MLPEEIQLVIETNFSREELPTNSYFGDGSPIEEETLTELRRLYEEEKVLFQWKKGDVLLLDNMFTAHGREPFEGIRTILVAMAEEARLP